MQRLNERRKRMKKKIKKEARNENCRFHPGLF